MIFFIVALCIFFSVIDFIKNKEIFSPIFIFNMMWAIVLILYQFNLSYIQTLFSFRTLLIFLSCVVSYDLTYLFFGKKIYKKIKFNKTKNFKFDEKKIKITNKVFLLIFIIEIIYSHGLPFFWRLTGYGKTYMDFGIPSIHGAINGLAIIMSLYYLLHLDKKSNRKYVAFYVLFAVLTLSRQVLMSIFIEFLCAKFYLMKKENKKISVNFLAVLLIIVIAGFTLLGNFRSGNDIMKDCFQPRENYQNLPSSIMWGYSYFTFSLSNFNNLVSLTDGFVNYGSTTIGNFLPSIITNNLNIKNNVDIYYLVSSAYNVSTYLPDMYLDFGIIGIIVMNILISFVTCITYLKMQYNKYEFGYVMLYAVCVHNIVFMFFINMWLYLPIIVQFAYIMYLRKKD